MTPNALTRAARRILRPLVHLMLRHGVSFNAASQLLKELYVDVASQDFGIPGRKQTLSRISTLTGLTRKDVRKALDAEHVDLSAINQKYNRAARVLTGWVRDARFRDASGLLRTLPFENGSPNFSELVHDYSGDIPPRAIADELLRVGAIKRDADDRLELIEHAYIPANDTTEKLNILGTDVAALIKTIEHNIYGDGEPRFQRKVSYDGISAAQLDGVRTELRLIAQTALERMDMLLAKNTSAPSADASNCRVGVGIYYFEERT